MKALTSNQQFAMEYGACNDDLPIQKCHFPIAMLVDQKISGVGNCPNNNHPTKKGIFHLQHIFEGDVKQFPKKGHLPTPSISRFSLAHRTRVPNILQDFSPNTWRTTSRQPKLVQRPNVHPMVEDHPIFRLELFRKMWYINPKRD